MISVAAFCQFKRKVLMNRLISTNKILTMFNRRKFIKTSALGSAAVAFGEDIFTQHLTVSAKDHPVVVSTWDAGIEANKGAWKILANGGRALDAVEAGVMVTEASQSCCVGL